MSLPPVIVKVKRKATDEPVDLLRVHELDNPRKRRATEYVFSLQSTPDVPTPTQRAPPAVRKIKELHRSASSQALGISSAPISRAESPAVQSLQETNEQPAVGSSTIQSAPATTPGTPNDSADALQQFKASQPRRFHISRSSTPSLLDSTGGGNRKRKAEPTVFVERRSRPKSKDGQSPGTSTPATFDETPRPQKKPGLAARSSTQPVKAPVPKPAIAPLRNVRLQSGEVIPWDVSSERLAAEMQAYTLAEIGKNIAASQTLKREPNYTSSHIHKSTPSKFKPKAPALRYAQRHPEEKIPANHDMTMDLNGPYVEDEADDDAEYIIDTYIRMPADALETEGMPKNIGFLILDSQPDIDEFYREEEESEEEEDDLDEDENAENHYTADYPDEEVDSDDEFGRNAYNYRTHNASDLEEFDGADDEDMAFSDDEYEGTKYPWQKKPAWLVGSKAGVTGDEDEDE